MEDAHGWVRLNSRLGPTFGLGAPELAVRFEKGIGFIGIWQRPIFTNDMPPTTVWIRATANDQVDMMLGSSFALLNGFGLVLASPKVS